jgi:hypothetical protein
VFREFAVSTDRSTGFLVTACISLAIVAVVGMSLVAVFPESAMFTMRLQLVYGFLYMFGWLTLMILGMLYRIVPTQLSKFLSARRIGSTGLRGAFVDPDLQIIVLVCLPAALVIASIGILEESVLLFRLGWAIWLGGIWVFFAGLLRLVVKLRSLLNVTCL